jgi:cellulose synthase/poly-beta-1,6-N-acetylglucosamine synthase-like glycosyltransferase
VKLLFWLSLSLVLYAYLFYPAWLYIRTRLRPRPVERRPIFPLVSIIIAARNEENRLEEKLQSLQQLDYPRELVEAIVVSDGSTDRTNEILANFGDPRVRSILLPVQGGKAEALNRGLEVVKGDVVVFMDVRQRITNDSIKTLVESLADPSVGCVSGALMLVDGGGTSLKGVGSYWEMEKAIRSWESASGSVVGATGALYALRRNLVPHLPTGLILDDVFIPMEVVRTGARVIYEPHALAWDNLASNPDQEFRRKVRTLLGNYQLLRLAPWLLTSKNPLRFEFVSHKLSRLAVPFALIGMILSSVFLSGFIYRLPLATAIGMGALGVLAIVRVPLGVVSRLTHLALAFILLNTAALVAFFYFVIRKKQVWVQ